MNDQLLPRKSGSKEQRNVPATTYSQLTTVETALGEVLVHIRAGFLPIQAGIIKVQVIVKATAEAVTTFTLPVLAHSPIDFVPQVWQARDDFIDDDLESILAQWALDEIRKDPTVKGVMVSYPKEGQAQHEINVAREIPCEPTRWNNNRTSERVTASYAADTLLDVVAKAYNETIKRYGGCMRIAIVNQSKRQGDGYYFSPSTDQKRVEYLVFHQNRMAAIIKTERGYMLADAKHTASIPSHSFEVAKRAVVIFVEAIKARHENFDMEIPEDEPTQAHSNAEAAAQTET